MIQIERVETKKQRRQFVNFIYTLNASDEHWIPPLKVAEHDTITTEKHPFYKENEVRFYLAFRNGNVIGRIASIFNKVRQQGYFGFLQAIEDLTVFKALLGQIEKDLALCGVSEVIGPVNPSINYEMGVLVDGFNTPPFLMLSHNLSYYDGMIKAAGYGKAKDFYSYILNKEDVTTPRKISRVKEKLEDKITITTRTPNMKNFDEELARIENVYNDAMSNHWGFVPMGSEEFRHMGKDLKQLIDPNMVFIAEVNGEAVGFIMILPNFNEVFKKIRNGKLFPLGLLKLLYFKNKIEGLRLITLGVKKKFQPLGIGSYLYNHAIENFKKSNYKRIEFSWVMEDNHPVNSVCQLFGARQYKTYRLYSKAIDGT